ncbi:hypothetical protein ACHAWF_016176, partial [Thalassiosira exigua]
GGRRSSSLGAVRSSLVDVVHCPRPACPPPPPPPPPRPRSLGSLPPSSKSYFGPSELLRRLSALHRVVSFELPLPTMSSGDEISLRGVLFRRTIRGGHASLAVIVTSDGEDEDQGGGSYMGRQEGERMVLVIVRLGGPEWEERRGREIDRSTPMINDSGEGNESMSLLRSNIRRMCKMGNEMEFCGHFVSTDDALNGNKTTDNETSTDWRKWETFIVDYYLQSTHSQQSNVRVYQELVWDALRCQTVRSKYFVSPPLKKQEKRRTTTLINSGDNTNSVDNTVDANVGENDASMNSKQRHHGGGIGKRKQGEIVAGFLLWVISTIYEGEESKESLVPETQSAPSRDQMPSHGRDALQENDSWHRQSNLLMERLVPLHPSLAHPNEPSVTSRNAKVANIVKKRTQSKDSSVDQKYDNEETLQKIISDLTPGGILDAAGGAGHVNLALALRGVHSTVIDPRPTVGRLPGRDRKVLKRSKQKPFSSYRAWFGSRPTGVDIAFRVGGNARTSTGHERDKALTANDGSVDPTTLPICSMCSDDNLLPNCTAIVALHPDEATGDIVSTAVESKIPFVVVPCCVFSRLFPDRIKPVREGEEISANTTVSTYFDLIDWLIAKHPAIKVTRLPFEGANIAVWATFK